MLLLRRCANFRAKHGAPMVDERKRILGVEMKGHETARRIDTMLQKHA